MRRRVVAHRADRLITSALLACDGQSFSSSTSDQTPDVQRNHLTRTTVSISESLPKHFDVTTQSAGTGSGYVRRCPSESAKHALLTRHSRRRAPQVAVCQHSPRCSPLLITSSRRTNQSIPRLLLAFFIYIHIHNQTNRRNR